VAFEITKVYADVLDNQIPVSFVHYISGPLSLAIIYLVHKPFSGCLLDPPSDGQYPEGKKENTILLKMCTKGTVAFPRTYGTLWRGYVHYSMQEIVF
jgi:hypothetical protein